MTLKGALPTTVPEISIKLLLWRDLFHDVVVEAVKQLNQFDRIYFRMVNLFFHFLSVEIVKRS